MSDLFDEPAERAVTSSSLAFRSGRVIDVRTDAVAMPHGPTAQRDVVVHPGAVGIIALNRDECVLLVQQYRHPVRRLLWEPPAGLLDEPGEDPLVAAKRELYEEAHVEASSWQVLVDAFTSPGMTDEAVRIYLAREVCESEQPRHVGEYEERDMPTEWVALEVAERAVMTGRLHNPMAVMGILAATRARSNGFRSLRPADVPWPEMSTYPGSAGASASGS
jgi:8-oxo-dGTP pyrophosphatase MutT (NUDIX family)